MLLCIGIGCYAGYMHYKKGIDHIHEEQQLYEEQLRIEEGYIHSKEAHLADNLLPHDRWIDEIYESLTIEPLVIAHSEIQDEKLLLTVVGSTQSFFTWYNKVSKEILYCRIRIVSILTQGHSISFLCEVTPIL